MASYSYADHSAQQGAKYASGQGGSGIKGPAVHFVNEFLKNDGDVAIVRFPYHSMEDISYETTHAVTFPGRKYPSRVRCDGAENHCVLCEQGIKVDTRVFIKCLVYVTNEKGEVELLNGVWDRPSAFADIDIKNLIENYGDISNYLFKIKKNGMGTATRYTTSVIMNTSVYKPDVYVADFTELEKVDAARILSKSVAQYEAAIHPSEATPTAAPTPSATRVTQTVVAAKTPEPVQPVASAVQETVTPEPQTTTRRATTRYQF